MHGLIFFYIQKFAEESCAGTTTWAALRSTITTTPSRYLPAGVYPDAEAVQLLESIAQATARPLPTVLEDFGFFLAPHLVKVAGKFVADSWKTLDLIENTESIIHTMVRATNPGAAPPVLEAVRPGPRELHLVYSSRRQLCQLAVGLMRGLARHFGETITIEEPSCMLRDDPFCSFVVRIVHGDTFENRSPLSETVVLSPAAGGRPDGEIHGLDDLPDGGKGPPQGRPVAIGGYTILELLGQGGMGHVYLAHDERLNRDVAVKVLNPAKARDQSARRRFLREGRAAAAVEHPHVMTIYHVGEDGGVPFMVMQRLEGRTLAQYREAAGRVPLPEVLRIGRETAEGLAAAHRRGLIHRDVKPDNIFLAGPRREVKIIDFGLARDASDEGAQVTVDGSVVGTPAYMSPERIGEQQIDAKSDLFGLGVILYELLADRLPFEGKSMVSVLAAISRGEPRSLAEVASDAPPAVCELVMRLIAHDKADRPADAAGVAADIAALERALGT